MKLEINVAVQICGTIMQALNAISGLVPSKYQFWIAGILGIVQAVSGILSHFSNPDGTPASAAYVKSAKVIVGMLLLTGLMICAPVARADSTQPDNVLAAGGSFNSQAVEKQFDFTGLYAKKLSDGLYSFTLADVTPSSWKPFRVVVNSTSGIAQHVRDIGIAKIYVVATAGVGASGIATGFAYSAGGAAAIPLNKKGLLLLPNIRVLKNTQTDFQAIYGLMIGWGK